MGCNIQKREAVILLWKDSSEKKKTLVIMWDLYETSHLYDNARQSLITLIRTEG